MKGGLLIGGHYFGVPGLSIIAPRDEPSWCCLDPGDYRLRRSAWIRQIIIHGTRGGWPQHVRPGGGPGKRAELVADFWRDDPNHSAAQLVVDTDGTVACLADLQRDAAFHATVSNDWSIGIEMAQVGDSEVYERTIAATVTLVRALCDLLAIPFQIPTAYKNHPIQRMLHGGRDMVGVFGHRDNTDRRGRGDPGDLIFAELELAGAERFDFDARADLARWMRRQLWLVNHGAKLEVDGVCGPATVRAMRELGFANGRAIDAAGA